MDKKITRGDIDFEPKLKSTCLSKIKVDVAKIINASDLKQREGIYRETLIWLNSSKTEDDVNAFKECYEYVRKHKKFKQHNLPDLKKSNGKNIETKEQ